MNTLLITAIFHVLILIWLFYFHITSKQLYENNKIKKVLKAKFQIHTYL